MHRTPKNRNIQLSALQLASAANGNHDEDKEITHWVYFQMKQRKSQTKEIRYMNLVDPALPPGLHLDKVVLRCNICRWVSGVLLNLSLWMSLNVSPRVSIWVSLCVSLCVLLCPSVSLRASLRISLFVSPSVSSSVSFCRWAFFASSIYQFSWFCRGV